jgi:hypothetical protein
MAAKFKLISQKLTFKHVGLVFAGCAFTVGGVSGWKWEESSSLDLANGNVGVGEEGVELLHQVLADEVRQVNLVERVAKYGQEDLLKYQVSGNGWKFEIFLGASAFGF